jgi:hypothetical protein
MRWIALVAVFVSGCRSYRVLELKVDVQTVTPVVTTTHVSLKVER